MSRLYGAGNCWLRFSGVCSKLVNQLKVIQLKAIQLTLTLKMTTAQVVETSVTVNNNSPIQDYAHPDDQTQPTFEMTPGFKPFTVNKLVTRWKMEAFLFI